MQYHKSISIATILLTASSFLSIAQQSLHKGPAAPKATFSQTDIRNGDEAIKSKEVSIEVSAARGADIYIDNTSRPFVINMWDQPKVKVVTTIFYEGDANKLSDEEWFDKLNLSVKSVGSSVKIKSGTVGSGSYSYGGNTWNWSSGGAADGVAVFDGNGENIKTKDNLKRIVTVYVPKDNKLDIESKYADITLTAFVAKLHLDMTNGNVETQDVGSLLLRSKYANVSLGNIKVAEIEFINGRLSAKDITELDVDTKYSTVEAGTVNKVTLRSTNDDYELEEVGVLQGRKNYGNLRITKLNNSIEMDGTNADVKIRNIGANISLIKFDDKYSDLRLPLRNVKNYTISYIGPWSTVYGNFEKVPLKDKDSKGMAFSDEMKALRNTLGDMEKDNTSNFSATVGNGKGAKIDIKCPNCTVDFK